jgi:hypothetical protein
MFCSFRADSSYEKARFAVKNFFSFCFGSVKGQCHPLHALHEGSIILLMVSTKKGRLFRIGEPLEEFFLIDDSVSGGFKMFSSFTQNALHVTEMTRPSTPSPCGGMLLLC